MTTPEKALVDTLYLGPSRSRLFAHLREVEIPRGFERRKALAWIARIRRVLGGRPWSEGWPVS